MAQDNRRVREIFLAALDLPTSPERDEFLNRECGGDASLRRRVADLLRAHDQPDPILDTPAAEHLPAEPTELELDFLAPTDVPGALGMLGHYRVMGVVGKGSMGVVLRAFDEKLHRIVAIKVLSPMLAASASARQRFVREARSAAAVAHENVVAIHAIEDSGSMPYLVMHFVEGITLQDKMDAAGPLEPCDVLRIALQVADGLAAAHRQGLIHRDVKPANILLENGTERAKLTDFGLARAADDASITQSGLVAGTPAFMSPEQASGERIDHRTDLFSLGSVMYAMCAGHLPFRANSSMAVLKRVCEEMPRSLAEINARVPNGVVAIIDRLLAKKPERRFQSAAEVAEVLRNQLADLQSPRSDKPPQPSLPWTKGGAIIAACLAIVALVVFRPRSEPDLASPKIDPTNSHLRTANTKEDWESLLNGKDLTGWRNTMVDGAKWEVLDGKIVGTFDRIGTFGGILATKREDYRNFHLRTSVRCVSGEFGLRARCTGLGFVVNSYRANFDRDKETWRLIGVAPTKVGLNTAFTTSQTLTLPNDWLDVEFVVQGNRLTVKANDTVLADVRDGEELNQQGAIGLDVYPNSSAPRAEVHFRSIEVKELP